MFVSIPVSTRERSRNHGYEDTKIADVVELARTSRPTLHEDFEGQEQCIAAAYESGVKRLVGAIEAAIDGTPEWEARLSVGLSAGLDFLAADPPLARLLLVDSLAAARPQYELTLTRLARALLPPFQGSRSGRAASEETARLLAGGLVAHLSGRVLAGEAELLPQSRQLLLDYLLIPSWAE